MRHVTNTFSQTRLPIAATDQRVGLQSKSGIQVPLPVLLSVAQQITFGTATIRIGLLLNYW